MKKYFKILLIFSIVVLLSSCVREVNKFDIYDFENYKINMIKDVEKSVVIITTDSGHGSGIIYDKQEGVNNYKYRYFAITNAHVIENTEEISIRFGHSSMQIPVSSYAFNDIYDIAILRIDTNEELMYHDIPPITKNKKVVIQKAQSVFAIGTPRSFSYFNYVTEGIVSLESYPYNGRDDLAIMHNAEVNPGNSGGPLFNLKGEVIGINVAKVPHVNSKDGEIPAEGLNYAININKVGELVNSFSEDSFINIVRQPKMGITVRNLIDHKDLTINPDYNPSDYPDIDYGVVIIDFDYTRNGHKVFLINDVIIKVNGKAINEIPDLQDILKNAEMGDKHSVTVLRKVDGEFIEITVTIELS